jgi:hypothetical protein
VSDNDAVELSEIFNNPMNRLPSNVICIDSPRVVRRSHAQNDVDDRHHVEWQRYPENGVRID